MCVHTHSCTHTHTHTHTHIHTELFNRNNMLFPDSTESLSLVFFQRWVTFSEIIWVRSFRLCRMFAFAEFGSFMSDLLTLIQLQGYICIAKMKVKVVRTFASSCLVELAPWMMHVCMGMTLNTYNFQIFNSCLKEMADTSPQHKLCFCQLLRRCHCIT